MINFKRTAAGGSAILFALLAGSVAEASAHGPDRVRCLLSRNYSNTHQVVTICDGRTAEGAARLKVASCDPAMMSDSAMRKRCAEMLASGA